MRLGFEATTIGQCNIPGTSRLNFVVGQGIPKIMLKDIMIYGKHSCSCWSKHGYFGVVRRFEGSGYYHNLPTNPCHQFLSRALGTTVG